MLVAFALWGIAGYRIALTAKDLHQQALAAGLTTLVLAQAAINIGAVVGVMPVTGVPLPFVSFGGSSLIVLLASHRPPCQHRPPIPLLRPPRRGPTPCGR